MFLRFRDPSYVLNLSNKAVLHTVQESQVYRIVSNKRPGGVAIFQKGMFIRGKFSMQKCSV